LTGAIIARAPHPAFCSERERHQVRILHTGEGALQLPGFTERWVPGIT